MSSLRRCVGRHSSSWMVQRGQTRRGWLSLPISSLQASSSGATTRTATAEYPARNTMRQRWYSSRSSLLDSIHGEEGFLGGSDGETAWQTATFRLLTQEASWKSASEWQEARQTIDWWIDEAGGSQFAVKLLQRMQHELVSPQPDSEMAEAVRDLLDENIMRAIVERWALDYSDSQLQFVLNPSDLSSLLESFRPYVALDQSLFELIHRTAARRALRFEAGSKEPLNADSLLPALAHAEQVGDDSICPSRAKIDALLRETVKDSTKPIAHWAQNVLDTMWSVHRKHRSRKIQPDHSIYQSVLRAWLKSDEPSKADNMRRLIEEMESLSFADAAAGLFPGSMHYMLLLSAYAEDGDATRAVDLVVHLKSRYEATGLVNYKPTGKIAGACIAAMSRSQDPDKARLADTLLEEQMSAFESTGDKSLLPRAPFWTSYIDIMVSDGTTESLERAEEVLGKMRTDRGFIQANPYHYGPIIRGWSNLKDPERAESVLHRMHRLDFKPDAKSFLDVIQAWTDSGDTRATDKIGRLSQLMSEVHRNSDLLHTDGTQGKDSSEPLALLKMLSTVASQEDAFRAEAVLRELVERSEKGETDTRLCQKHYQAVITAWSKTNDKLALHRAESLLLEMLRKYDAGDEHLRPTEHGFTSVIAACGRSRRDDSGRRAQALFDIMCERYKAGEEGLRPSVRSYSALIKAWAAEGKADRAEHVLQQMNDDFLDDNFSAMPNAAAFNTVLSAWSKHSSEEALQRATQILRLMQKLGDSHLHVAPDIISFSSTIACCIRSNAHWRVDLAESLLQEAKNRYTKGFEVCRPNSMIYGAVIQTIARSNSDKAAARCEYYLKEMLALSDFDARQVLMTHTAIIGAWAREDDTSVALASAEALVRNLIALSKSRRTNACLPNKFTYAQFLRVLSRSSLADKRSRMEATMREMELLGVQADDAILRLARSCVTA